MAFLFTKVHGVYCVENGDETPSAAAWSAWIAAVRGDSQTALSILVRTGSGAPTAVQRSELNTLGAERPVVIAVVTESKIARGAILALGWLGQVKLSGFAPEEEAAALEYLGIARSDWPAIRAELDRLRGALGRA